MSHNPLDRFLDGYAQTLQLFDQQADDLESFTDPAQAQSFTQALQELQMATWAAGTVASKRHGLLKKVMDELR